MLTQYSMLLLFRHSRLASCTTTATTNVWRVCRRPPKQPSLMRRFLPSLSLSPSLSSSSNFKFESTNNGNKFTVIKKNQTLQCFHYPYSNFYNRMVERMLPFYSIYSRAMLSTKVDSKKVNQKNNTKHRPSFEQTKETKFGEQFGDNDKQQQKLKWDMLNRIYTLPNALCAFRICLTPVVGYLIVMQEYKLALALCAISAGTDFLDGWIARTFNAQSKLGALLDPLADKLLVITLTFALTYVQLIPLWLTSLIVTRDSLIIAGGVYIHCRSLSSPFSWTEFFNMDTFKSDRFAPTAISKINTGFQLSLVLISLTSPLLPNLFSTNWWLLPSLQAVTGLTTLWSGLNYLTRLRS